MAFNQFYRDSREKKAQGQSPAQPKLETFGECHGINVDALGTQADRDYGKHLGIGETPEERAETLAACSKQ